MLETLSIVISVIIYLSIFFLIEYYIFRSYLNWLKKSFLSHRQLFWKNLGFIILILGNLLFIFSMIVTNTTLISISSFSRLLAYLGGFFFSSLLLALIVLCIKDFIFIIHRLYRYFIMRTNRVRDIQDLPNQSRRSLLKYGGAASVLAISSAPVVSTFMIGDEIQIIKKIISFNNFPKSMNGLTIAQLSDIHAGAYMNLENLTDIFHLVNSLQPNIIVITGDFVDKNTYDLSALSNTFQLLQSDIGVFGCLGNHDHYAGAKDISNMLENSGIKMLNNDGKTLFINNDKISILGVDYEGTKMHPGGYSDIRQALKKVNSDSFKIMLSHNPDFFTTIKKYDIDLTLAGHTHGGQIGFKIGGLNINPAYLAFRYPKGHYIEENKHLYVNVGIGNYGLPIRTIKPEITLLTLSG